ncbi:4332_t:CDS:2 [Funneliformis geosporum]|nr:4332_t:CDS:2 [Funneliformis geosporum]
MVVLKKITASASHALGQYLRHDTSLSTRTLARKLENIGIETSYRTVRRHLSSAEILHTHAPEMSRMLGGGWRFKQDNDSQAYMSSCKSFLPRKLSSRLRLAIE